MGRRKGAASGDDADTLTRFVQRVDRVTSHSALQRPQAFSPSWSFSWERGADAEFTREGLSDEEFEGVLTRLRPLITADDALAVRKVWNILETALDGDEYRQAARGLRQALRAAMRSSGFGYVVDDENVPPELLLDLVMNGQVFHDDIDKAERLQRLVGPVPSIVQHNVEVLVLRTVLIVEDTAELIRRANAAGALPWRLAV